MLLVFLERLEERWVERTDYIFAVAKSMWNGAEIDLVCILPTAIVVANLKIYGDKLIEAKGGSWKVNGAIVKGSRKTSFLVEIIPPEADIVVAVT